MDSTAEATVPLAVLTKLPADVPKLIPNFAKFFKSVQARKTPSTALSYLALILPGAAATFDDIVTMLSAPLLIKWRPFSTLLVIAVSCLRGCDTLAPSSAGTANNPFAPVAISSMLCCPRCPPWMMPSLALPGNAARSRKGRKSFKPSSVGTRKLSVSMGTWGSLPEVAAIHTRSAGRRNDSRLPLRMRTTAKTDKHAQLHDKLPPLRIGAMPI
mmetsp:Transcript_103642/g.292515  ORF Transcript_103642/g.292515 Transcript_103642/m.292515 type:complete len:214 (+) Transcript_103642:602-1243(+)